MAKIESMEPGSILRLVPTEIIKSESKHPYLNKITGRRYWLDTYILHGFRERLPFGPSLIKQRFIYISKVGSLHNICLYNNFKNNFFGKGYSTLVLPELEVSKIGHIIDIRKLDTIKDSFFSRKIDYKFNFTPPIQSLLQSISKQSQKTVDDKLAFYNRNTILPFIEDMGDLYALLALRENNSCNYCGSYFWSNKTKIIHYGNFNQKKIRSKTIRIIVRDVVLPSDQSIESIRTYLRDCAEGLIKEDLRKMRENGGYLSISRSVQKKCDVYKVIATPSRNKANSLILENLEDDIERRIFSECPLDGFRDNFI